MHFVSTPPDDTGDERKRQKSQGRNRAEQDDDDPGPPRGRSPPGMTTNSLIFWMTLNGIGSFLLALASYK